MSKAIFQRTTSKFVATLIPQSSDRVEWEQDVTHYLEILADCDTSDAQGLLMCQDFLLEQCWRQNIPATKTAHLIDDNSKIK